MRDNAFWSPALRRPPGSSSLPRVLVALVGCVLMCAPRAVARKADAPQWMHSLVDAALPAHDEKTDAILMYSDRALTVLSVDKVRTVTRVAYKILRPSGREYGTVIIPFNSNKRITNLRGWCVPAQGEDYEVKDKQTLEISLPKIEGSDLVTDVRAKTLQIPAPDPGNIIGYEYVAEERPLVLQASWEFQITLPARESRYSLELPPGWEYKAAWRNYPEVKPTQGANGQWQWSVSDVKAIHEEEDMPPLEAVAGEMVINLFPPAGAHGFTEWNDMGQWYLDVTRGRRDASEEIKQKVAALTAAAATPLAKMQALAAFVQREIRYVAIELGIGGFQPHAASGVFQHRYGDCKDKATLMGAMLQEIGVDSYYVVINTDRGSVTPDAPAGLGAFDHAILAIRLPEGVSDPSLIATIQHPRLGKLLFFDPTSDLTPFGQIPGRLQANYGLLVAPDRGELTQLPRQASGTNGIWRTGKLTLSAAGTLTGDVEEVRWGDLAASRRRALLAVTKEADPNQADRDGTCRFDFDF